MNARWRSSSRRLLVALGVANLLLCGPLPGPRGPASLARAAMLSERPAAPEPGVLADDRQVPGGPLLLPAGARVDQALTRLFTPPRPFGGRYEVYVTTETLDRCLAHFRRVTAATERPREAWEPRRLEPRKAFGKSGLYPRSRLARLYGGSPVFVARGSLRADGRFVASVTVFSPYPDPAFTRLEPGTMLIVFRPDTPGLPDARNHH